MKYFKIIPILLCLFLIPACSGIRNTADEAELKEMLSENYAYELIKYIAEEEITFVIDHVEIIRRQTNTDEKQDIVDCKIFATHEDYTGVFYYRLTLNFYDEGGWQLDECSSQGMDEYKALRNTVSEDRLSTEVNRFIQKYGNCVFSNETYDIETQTLYRTYTVDSELTYLTAKGTVTISYAFLSDYADWQLEEEADNVESTWNLPTYWSYEEYEEIMDTTEKIRTTRKKNDYSVDDYLIGYDSLKYKKYNDEHPFSIKGIEIIGVDKEYLYIDVHLIIDDLDGGWVHSSTGKSYVLTTKEISIPLNSFASSLSAYLYDNKYRSDYRLDFNPNVGFSVYEETSNGQNYLRFTFVPCDFPSVFH